MLVCLLFWKYNNFGWLICAYICFKRKNGWHVPQGLIIRAPISHYSLCSAMFCPLHSNKSKDKVQYEKHLCNPSSHYRKYKEYARETCTPYLDRWKPLTPQFQQCWARFITYCSKQGIVWEVPLQSLCCTEAIVCLPQIVTLPGCEGVQR